jgi:hypothetical protein
MDEILPVAYKLLLEELPLPAGSPGGMEAYRCSLTISFFFKFYLQVRLQLENKTVWNYAKFNVLMTETFFLFVNFSSEEGHKSGLKTAGSLVSAPPLHSFPFLSFPTSESWGSRPPNPTGLTPLLRKTRCRSQ